jgi:hypothetical protein
MIRMPRMPSSAGASRTQARTAVVIHEFSPALSRAGGLSASGILAALDAAGFLPYAFAPHGGIVGMALEELGSFQGQGDLVWIKPASALARRHSAHGAQAAVPH